MQLCCPARQLLCPISLIEIDSELRRCPVQHLNLISERIRNTCFLRLRYASRNIGRDAIATKEIFNSDNSSVSETPNFA
jgi:hypothetical protein